MPYCMEGLMAALWKEYALPCWPLFCAMPSFGTGPKTIWPLHGTVVDYWWQVLFTYRVAAGEECDPSFNTGHTPLPCASERPESEQQA